MVFSSTIFLFVFLPICLLLYYIVNQKYKNTVLLFFSIVFYAWGETKYIWLIGLSIVFNYFFGILLSKTERYKLGILLIGVFVNVAVLFFYKYSGFFAQFFNVKNDYLTQLILPLGISFYTFHSISYLVDIYRKKAIPQFNFIKMGLYIVNFPQLVAGPIIRYHDVESQLTNRKHFLNRFNNGVKLFIYGLAKKMIIANTVGIVADVVFDKSYGSFSNVYAWIGIFSYTLQIYFDFSGYSDMAIGIGKMFGFEFKHNFKLPYSSTSIREFWQKWHISLSNWFRDYVYIPLGGNKHGGIRTCINLMIVFVLCGFWHGANFTFLFWGLFHGFFLVIERISNNRFFDNIPKIIKLIYVWFTVMIGWVFFRSNSIEDAVGMIRKMFYISSNSNTMPDVVSFVTPYFIFISIIGFLISIGIFKNGIMHCLRKRIFDITMFRKLESLMLLFLFFWSVLEITNSSYNPFIYFRF